MSAPSIEECIAFVAGDGTYRAYTNAECNAIESEIARILRTVKEARKSYKRWDRPEFINDSCQRDHCDGCEGGR